MQYVAVCCSVLQCAVVCCGVLQCVAVCCIRKLAHPVCRMSEYILIQNRTRESEYILVVHSGRILYLFSRTSAIHCNRNVRSGRTQNVLPGCTLRCVAECCSVLQCVAVCCRDITMFYRKARCLLQCVAVCCSVLQ